jgi:cytochrome c peroxidase
MYVRSLVNLNSKFDQDIRGASSSMTAKEIQGANLFLGKAACATCHFPPSFNGFVPPYYNDTEGEILGTTTNGKSSELDDDLGVYERFKHSYPEATYIKGMFKTPTIRNIEFTAPYMHNGTFESLEEVVKFYNNGGGAGLGINIPQQTLATDSLNLSEAEKEALVAFMKTLSDTSGTNVSTFPLPSFPKKEINNRIWGGRILIFMA